MFEFKFDCLDLDLSDPTLIGIPQPSMMPVGLAGGWYGTTSKQPIKIYKKYFKNKYQIIW